VILSYLSHKVVVPGLVPGIHVFGASRSEDVDGRDEPGHDGISGKREEA
jgi:hypothetical protein